MLEHMRLGLQGTGENLLHKHTAEQYDYSAAAQIRRAQMELSASGRDYYGDLFRMAYGLGLSPTAPVLILGSNNGEDEYRLVTEFQHTGPIYGLELPGDDFETRFYPVQERLAAEGIKNVVFVPGNAEDLKDPKLGFQEGQFSGVFGWQMIYHAKKITKVIRQIGWVLEPGGIVGLSSNGQHNKSVHHEFLRKIGDFSDSEDKAPWYKLGRFNRRKPPRPFSSRMDYGRLYGLFPYWFDYAAEVRQREPLEVRNQGDVDIYIGSLDTYRRSYKPPFRSSRDQEERGTNPWLRARKSVAEEAIERDIARCGVFRDWIDRGGVFGFNPENPSTLQRLGRLGLLNWRY